MEIFPCPSPQPLHTLLLELQIDVTLVELLKRTRAYIEHGWTQETQARDAEDNIVAPTAATASRFCLSGALYRACADMLGPVDVTSQPGFRDCFARLEDRIHAQYAGPGGYPTLDRYAPPGGYPALETWNDLPRRRKSEVLALIEETIASLK